MKVSPAFCPYTQCTAHRSRPFRYQHRGRYSRRCDGRSVPRFQCLECRRFFSSQSFRLDFGLHRPGLLSPLFGVFISKVTLRQAARVLSCSRGTVARQLDRLGEHCRDFHRDVLRRSRRAGALRGSWMLDELETFEHSRRLAPLTVPVLIESGTYFVLDLEVDTLPARGRLAPALREKKRARAALLGVRRNRSQDAVSRCLDTLQASTLRGARVVIATDRKPSYVGALRRRFGGALRHSRHSSTAVRNYKNPLFPINHTLAMLRDGLSRLVRRTWATTKSALRLERHLWIWVCWRNYLRGITNKAPATTPAMALGLLHLQLRRRLLLARRVFP